MIYITSDLHFGHDKEFMYSPRGFKDIEEADNAIVNNWNSIVTDEDDVYVLGDVMLNDDENGIRHWNQLKGNKHLIIGNHDSDVRIKLLKECPDTEVLGHASVIKYDGFSFYLSHYPTITSSFEYNKRLKLGLINLCGHTHAKDRFIDEAKGRIYHCELDCHGNKPVSIEEIISDLIGKNESYRANDNKEDT
ncbi:MAG: metallophosphoesterase family protein [Saccharofermentans sp.]|nr:metallophosphoesterase family protein [Saccharofermentans sp.]